MILGTWLYVMSFSLSSQVVSSRVVFCRVMSCLDAAVASCLGTGPLMSCPFFGVAFHVHALSLLLVLCHVLFSLLVTCHVVSCNDFPCLGPLRFIFDTPFALATHRKLRFIFNSAFGVCGFVSLEPSG